MASPTISTLTSFSGADLVATFANKAIGELQQISWAVQRDKAPVFTCGSADARSFSRGKRGIAGSMVFAVFDHDSLVEALQTVWQDIAPSAMFTAAANNVLSRSEDFTNAMDMIKWNQTVTYTANGISDNNNPIYEQNAVSTNDRAGYGFSFSNTTTSQGTGRSGAYSNNIKAQTAPGSNNKPTIDSNGFVDPHPESWDNDAADTINVPAGFAPIRGQNVIYADTLPPFDITLTFGSEYGHTAFQKIYDVDILNESSGASVDTVIMSRQLTWIARRLSPLIRGVYTRESNGTIIGKLVNDVTSDTNMSGV
jgi:hypothetical protein